MDYLNPIRSIFPGVDGAVLSALAHSDGPLTIRQIAQRSGTSHPQVSHHIQRFEVLGLVGRQVVGPSHLIALTQSAAAQLLRELDGLWKSVADRMADTANQIEPAPESVILYGSFARGEARAGSDIDVLIVRPDNVAAGDSEWEASLAAWVDAVAELAGNPVAEVVVGVDEVERHRGEPWWEAIRTEGVVIAGKLLQDYGNDT